MSVNEHQCPHCGASLETSADMEVCHDVSCPQFSEPVAVSGESRPRKKKHSRLNPGLGAATATANGSRLGIARGAIRDFKPLVERNDSNALSRAEQIRDRIYDLFVEAASGKHVDAAILKSTPFTAPPWVLVECWVRHRFDPALTLRSSAKLTIRPQEFYRFPFEIDLTIKDDKRTRNIARIRAFEASDAKKLLRHLLFENRSRNLGLKRCRNWPHQLWLPRNKPERLGVNPRTLAAAALFMVGLALTIAVAPNLRFRLATVPFGVGLLFIFAALFVAYIDSNRPRYVLSAGKPSQEPRELIRLDSWQALIMDLGGERDAVLEAIEKELHHVGEQDFLISSETISYWGVNGKEEREQLVVRFRRAIGFIHIYQYGKDLYVGWDAHVNRGSWFEKVAGSGYYDTESEQNCAVSTVVNGWHVTNEYDLSDTNCLLERIHAAITRVVQLKMAEHRIDQEVDFKIFRESRQSILKHDNRNDDVGGRGVLTRVFSGFRRIE